MPLDGLRCVFYVDLAANIPVSKLTAEHLAELAIASAALAGDKNGIRYLADNIDHGVITPLTDAYCSEVLRKTGAGDLRSAERLVRSSNRTV
jgi:hypothetical protein